ncbi:MAG: hypothetical protein AAFO99_15115, partial [Bacteroidota bacterium]
GSEEQNTIDKLLALGYTVTVVDDNVGGNADDFTVTFVYEDANSGLADANVDNLTTTTKGVITSETFLHDEILGANQGVTTTTNIMNITNNIHPITANLSLGNNDIGNASYRANNLVSGTVLGLHPNGQVSIAIWEPGDAMDVGIAPGRRAIVPHSNDSGVFNAAGEDLLVSAIVWTAGIDTDLDGIDDRLDLDSDNDGIYDVVEAGHDQTHTNGRLTSVVGLDGVPDIVQAAGQEDSGNVNYAVQDSDTDGERDAIELDSDNDGCNDVNEAGYTDDNDDGQLGPLPITVDTSGVVTSGSDGYTAPADADANLVFDFREVGTVPSITIQPIDVTGPPGCDVTFSVVATNADTYQWQLFNGSVWADLSDSGIYGGTTTATLTLTNITNAENGNQYRVLLSSDTYVCQVTTSDTATLTVNVPSVITNRRITYRVRKN